MKKLGLAVLSFLFSINLFADIHGVTGGLVVCVGSEAIEEISNHWKAPGYIFQCLETDPAKVSNLRKKFREADVYGKVTAEVFDGTRLPYTGNIVNLIVQSSEFNVQNSEYKRVLAPQGVAVINGKRMIKPRPDTIDDWTHFLHSADNNAVAKDSVVASPYHIQWVGSPRHAKSHSKLTTINVLVSAAGRLFYIVDEGPTALPKSTPAQWSLYARDAFSGVTLWKRPISSWNPYDVGSRHNFPVDLYRRLVADTDRVFATLSIFGPVSAIDAATGKTLRTYAGTEKTEEIIHEGDAIYLVINTQDESEIDRRAISAERTVPVQKRITAIEADTGRVLWSKEDKNAFGVMPMTLAAKSGRVYFQNTEHIICCDAKTGDEVWRTSRPTDYGRPGWSTPTLVVTDEVVLSADRGARTVKTSKKSKKNKIKAKRGKPLKTTEKLEDGKLLAFSAKTGKLLWTGPAFEGAHSPVDVFVAKGRVYTGENKSRSQQDYRNGRDLRTGKVVDEIPLSPDWVDFHHHRCYRDKATERFILSGRTGIEFTDLKTGEVTGHNWIRGICKYGILPCNGMIYMPPDQCGCYIESKISGFFGLAPARPMGAGNRGPDPDIQRLEKGPAYNSPLLAPRSALSASWPTYRGSNERSGYTASAIPAELKQAWTVQLGGALSAITSADGKIFVAQVDAHLVHAINIATGKIVWSYPAASRVDSPPTIAGGLAVFGCRDGRVYAVRVSDGKLAWRYLAAPRQHSLVVDDQLESVWPINGSVLVKDGAVYCAAGRNSNLDGGVYMVKLDLITGKRLATRRYFSRNPEDNRSLNLYKPFPSDLLPERELPGIQPDIPSSDGKNIFMRAVTFNDRLDIQPDHPPHLFCSMGFLDSSWWERTYWIYGPHFYSGCVGIPYAKTLVPAGRLLVFDDQTVFGYADETFPFTGMFATPKTPNLKKVPKKKDGKKFVNSRSTKILHDWRVESPILSQAMVLSADTFFVAGANTFDTYEASRELGSSTIDPRDPAGVLREALDAFEGRRAGQLLAVNKADGKIISHYRLGAPPVFDGMAAAEGRLFISTASGTIECWKPAAE